MTTHADHQRALAIKAGQDHRFNIDIEEDDGTVTDYTGATPLTDAAVFCPKTGSSFTKDIVLSTPASAPQLYVDLVPADTSALTVPQRINVYLTITKAGGKIDKPSFAFDLLKGAC